MQTKGHWQGVLNIQEEQGDILIGSFKINSIFHFLVGKRVILNIEVVHGEDVEQDAVGQLSTVGKLEYDEKKKVLLLEKYPLIELLQSFGQQNVELRLELDQSVLSSRM